ncbi:hypothetical protein [Scytonema sp. NUACC26]|uniref:hypothetical protein n=1 Tax=Scytonema sp. NUACC26 TaxID=3140176 RepID=UPI0038B40C11
MLTEEMTLYVPVDNTQDILKLYEPELKRKDIAGQLGVTERTISRYIEFGSNFIPDLKEYLAEDGCSLNRKAFRSSHLHYLEEIRDLKRKYSPSRVIEILTRKYAR